jgi:hypothetical protein
MYRRNLKKYLNLRESEVVFRFKDIGEELDSLISKFYRNYFNDHPLNEINTETTRSIINDSFTSLNRLKLNVDSISKYPQIDLFIYCIVAKKSEMIKTLWRDGNNENQLCSCLIASKIYKSLANQYMDSDYEYYINLSQQFSSMASNILQLAYEINPTKAQISIMREIKPFGYSTCLQIARIANDINFIAQPCVQDLLTRIWYNKISPDNNKVKIIFCMIMPVLSMSSWFLRFKHSHPIDQNEKKQQK